MLDKEFIGKWQIVEMERWDQNFINLIEIPYIEFHDAGFGTFYFGTICANIDYQINEEGRAEFSFYGDDEGQEVFGRGWAKINSQGLHGRLFFHEGDASEFQAIQEIPMNQNVLLKRKKKNPIPIIDKITLFS